MSNEDKMLQLVLSDEKLWKTYNTTAEKDPLTGKMVTTSAPFDVATIHDALRDENPIVVAIAKIIRGMSTSDRSAVYKEVVNFLLKKL